MSDPISALLGPVSHEDQLQALADSLRKRKRAADFFAMSTIKPLAQAGQTSGAEIMDSAKQQGLLRQAVAEAQATAEAKQADRDARSEEGRLNRAASMQRTLARGPSVVINGEGDPGAKKYFEQRGEADSKALDAIYAGADQSQKLVNNLNAFAEVLDGVSTGSLSNIQVDFSRLGSSLGLEIPADMDKLQAGRAIANQLALLVRNPDSGLGMPGQVSDRDVNFLKESMPRIVNTPGGNKMIIEVLKRVSARAVERAQKATEFEQSHEGRFKQVDFEKEWAKHVNENSLFEDLNPKSANDQEVPDDSWSEAQLDAYLAKHKKP